MQTPEIRLQTRSSSPRVNRAALLAVARALFAASLPLARRRGVAPWDGGVDVILLSPRQSAAAHFAATGLDEPADVVTLRYAAGPMWPARAELLVCPAVAVRNAAARDPETLLAQERGLQWGASEELALYLAHGFDHLAGSDDATAAGYRAMRLRELRWLAAASPLPPLVRSPRSR